MLGGLSPVVGRFRKSLRLWREESFRFRKDVLRRVHDYSSQYSHSVM